MRYREAKLLVSGAQVIRKEDKITFTVNSIEIFGQYKKVKLYCSNKDIEYETLYNDEIE